MTSEEILKRLGVIIFKQLKESGNQSITSPDAIKADASFMVDLGADSLDVVEIIASLEEEFNLLIPDEVLEGVRTVRDAMQYLEANV